MKRLLLATLLLSGLLLSVFGQASNSRVQYGFRFAYVNNDVSAIPGGANNPFTTVTLKGQPGFVAGVVYDAMLYRGRTSVAFSFGAGYKLYHFKGNFTAPNGTSTVNGTFHNYYHMLDMPLGVKVINSHLAGHPYVGGGLQIDYALGERSNVKAGGSSATYNTTPGYSSRVNTGLFGCVGLEIPGGGFNYCVEGKYIDWNRDNFKKDMAFFQRGGSEFQIAFIIKTK